MNYLWTVLFVLFTFVSDANCSPFDKESRLRERRDSPYVVEYEKTQNASCDQTEESMWVSHFHNCFIDRKYNDGGRDLSSIVDRILQHAVACTEVSVKDCRPTFDGFLAVLNKTITQIKDYAQIYLEAIFKDRENIKDLECVESTINIESYEKCFERLFNSSRTDKDFESSVQNSISCVNRKNRGCSKEAKTSLNKIVRMILDVDQPEVEIIEEDPPKEEKPWMWYDYLAYPFVTAWNAIRKFFNF